MSFALRDYQISLVQHLKLETTPPQAGDRLLVQVATGGGKTCVINEFLRNRVARGARVLVVTKDWTLLFQAAEDFAIRCRGEGLVGYVGQGPEARKLFGRHSRTVNQPVVYTTIHSWSRRADLDFKDQHFDYVVIDELHWGEGAPLYSKLWERYEKTSVFLGFTATPRKWTAFRVVDKPYDFAELLSRDILARPIIIDSQQTNVDWAPRLSSEHGDIAQTSLNELAANESRNRLIIRTYTQNQKLFGKTLVFACSIDHAEVLSNHFRNAGIQSAALHHKLPIEEKHGIRQAFEAGQLSVLVNVTMFTHGVDIPSINSIFLARPTTSDILFSQMIGRGSRRIPGVKDVFNVVDFVDSVQMHGIPIIRPDGFLGSVALTRKSRGPVIDKHDFRRHPFTSFPHLPGYEELAGLDIQPEQTFGIEFEVAPKSGATDVRQAELVRVGTAMRDALSDVVGITWAGQDGARNDHGKWYLKRDGSCGLEITTRILKGVEGFMEVYNVLRILNPLLDRLGYRVSKLTGTHVHLGWRGVPFNSQKQLMHVVGYYEPAINSLVSPSRVKNIYAMSVRGFFKRYRLEGRAAWKEYFSDEHYLGVSLQPLYGRYGTTEVRIHNGTLDGPKILTWVSLWMRILDRAHRASVYPGDPSRRLARSPLCPGPRGDVAHLAEFVKASPGLTQRLVERRRHVVHHSWVRHEKWGKLATTMFRKWYPDRPLEEPPNQAVAWVG